MLKMEDGPKGYGLSQLYCFCSGKGMTYALRGCHDHGTWISEREVSLVREVSVYPGRDGGRSGEEIWRKNQACCETYWFVRRWVELLQQHGLGE